MVVKCELKKSKHQTGMKRVKIKETSIVRAKSSTQPCCLIHPLLSFDPHPAHLLRSYRFLLLFFSFISYSLVSFLFNFNSDKAFCPEMKTNVVSYTSMIESSSCHFLCQGKEGEGSCWPTRPSRRPAARPTWSRWPPRESPRWPPRGSPAPPPSASCYSSPSAGLILTPDQSQRPSKSFR